MLYKVLVSFTSAKEIYLFWQSCKWTLLSNATLWFWFLFVQSSSFYEGSRSLKVVFLFLQGPKHIRRWGWTTCCFGKSWFGVQADRSVFNVKEDGATSRWPLVWFLFFVSFFFCSHFFCVVGCFTFAVPILLLVCFSLVYQTCLGLFQAFSCIFFL